MNPLRRLFRRWVVTYKYDNKDLWDLGLEWRAYKVLKKEFGHLLTEDDRKVRGGNPVTKSGGAGFRAKKKRPTSAKSASNRFAATSLTRKSWSSPMKTCGN